MRPTSCVKRASGRLRCQSGYVASITRRRAELAGRLWNLSKTSLLIAHPHDRGRLASLPGHRKLRTSAYGPYHYRESVGLFD